MTTLDKPRERLAPGVRHFGVVNWLGLWTLYRKEVQRFLKIFGQTIAAPAANSLLFLLIFSLAIGKFRPDINGVPFIVFMAPGLIMMSILQNAFTNSGSSVLGSKIQGNVVDVLMPPISSGELATAFALGAATRGLCVAAMTYILIVPFVDLWPTNLLAVLFFAFGASLMLSLIGLLTGIWAEKWDHMSTIGNFIITPLSFLSGTFYSIRQLPPAWQTVSEVNPFFYMIDGFRYGFTGQSEGNLLVGISLIIGVNLALWLLTIALLNKGYKLKA